MKLAVHDGLLELGNFWGLNKNTRVCRKNRASREVFCRFIYSIYGEVANLICAKVLNSLLINYIIAMWCDSASKRRVLACLFYSVFKKDKYICYRQVQLEAFKENIYALQRVQRIIRDLKIQATQSLFSSINEKKTFWNVCRYFQGYQKVVNRMFWCIRIQNSWLEVKTGQIQAKNTLNMDCQSS